MVVLIVVLEPGDTGSLIANAANAHVVILSIVGIVLVEAFAFGVAVAIVQGFKKRVDNNESNRCHRPSS